VSVTLGAAATSPGPGKMPRQADRVRLSVGAIIQRGERRTACLGFRCAYPGYSAVSAHRGWVGTLIGAQLVRPVSTQSWLVRNCAIVLASQMPQ
jgi:hypothetical protein